MDPIDITPITGMAHGTEDYDDELKAVLGNLKTGIEQVDADIDNLRDQVGFVQTAADNADAKAIAAQEDADNALTAAAAVGASLTTVQAGIPTQITSTIDSLKAQPNQLATLDANGLLLLSQFPENFTTNPYPVISQAAMLALNVGVGDIALRTDLNPNKSFILSALPASTLGNWIEMSGGSIVSVNGKTGVVVLGVADITNLQAALDAKRTAAQVETAISNRLWVNDDFPPGTFPADGVWLRNPSAPPPAFASDPDMDYMVWTDVLTGLGSVSSITNQAGLAINFTQATGVAQPQLVYDATLEANVLSFSGTQFIQASLGVTRDTDTTMFAVVRSEGTQGTKTYVGGVSGSSAPYRAIGQVAAGGSARVRGVTTDGSVQVPTSITDIWRLVMVTFNAATGAVQVFDNVASAPVTGTILVDGTSGRLDTVNSARLGYATGSPSSGLVGRIAMVAQIHRLLSANTIRAYAQEIGLRYDNLTIGGLV